jgi:TDG/mug DNA glycosylase family protein
MVRYTFHGAKLLFVGINPHPGSFQRGVPFSNNKTFWYLLSRAGLLDESIEDLRDDEVLRRIYRRKFTQTYKLGFVNVIDRPTEDVTYLTHGEEIAGQRRLRRIIRQEKPRVICFVGKIAFQKFCGTKNFSFGWQEDIDSSRIYVMHFPLHGKASVRIQELKDAGRAADILT